MEITREDMIECLKSHIILHKNLAIINRNFDICEYNTNQAEILEAIKTIIENVQFRYVGEEPKMIKIESGEK